MRVNGAYRPSSGRKVCRMSMTRAQCNEETRQHITTTIPDPRNPRYTWVPSGRVDKVHRVAKGYELASAAQRKAVQDCQIRLVPCHKARVAFLPFFASVELGQSPCQQPI